LLDSPYLHKLGQKSSNELASKNIHPGEFHQRILLVYEKGCETFLNQKEPHYSSRDFELLRLCTLGGDWPPMECAVGEEV
jgi:hypothetical protein